MEATDNLSGFDWATTNPDLYPVQYIFLLDGAVDPPPPFIQYARGSSVDIPENAVGLLVKAMVIA